MRPSTCLVLAVAMAASACAPLFPDADPSPRLTPDTDDEIVVGGVVDYVVHGDGRELGVISASLNNPNVAAIERIVQEAGSPDAIVTIRAIGFGRSGIEISGDGWTRRFTFQTRHPEGFGFFRVPAGTLPLFDPDRIKADASGPVNLAAWVMGEETLLFPEALIGRGVLIAPTTDEFAVEYNPLEPDYDSLRLGPAAPGEYTIPLTLAGESLEPITYIAVTEDDAMAMRLSTPAVGNPRAGTRSCTVAEPTDAELDRILGPRARWIIDGVPQDVLGEAVCFDHVPDGPAHGVIVRYGTTEAGITIHGENLAVLPVGAQP